MPSFYPENIPQQLKDIAQWVLWKLEQVIEEATGEPQIDPLTGEIKLTKVPYQHNGKKANTARKETWAAFEQTLAVYDSSDEYTGLGFVLTKETGLVAVDFDHVLHAGATREDGCVMKQWNEGVLTEISELNSFAEISQSGEGVHVFCKGTLPTAGRKKGNREMYCDNRFFAVTGDHISQTPLTLNEAQECITDYYEMWFEQSNTKSKPLDNPSLPKSPEMSDEEVLRHCWKAANSEKFNRLHSGDTSDYHSNSEAQHAYCSLLAFYTQKREQIDRMLRASVLYDKKWDRRGKYTLDKVLDGLTEVYQKIESVRGRFPKDKINNPVKEFKVLMDGSIPYYQSIIGQLPKSDNQSVNINTANQFLDEMISLPIDVIDNLINHEIKDRFDFNRDDCRNLKRYFKRTKAENMDEQSSDIFKKYIPPFAEVADRVMERRAFFTFDDTKEIYVYRNGVYVSKGAETEIKQLSRDICCQMYEQHDLLQVVPSMTYVSEILELIRVRTAVYRDEIDNNPKNKYIINMKNGLYNIKTGELTAHTEEYISLRQIPVNYNPTANAPKFRKFMSEIVTPEDAQVLLEFIGYSLIFDIKHDQAIMLQGTGANGKSILLQFIIALHGEENICSTSLQRLCEDRFALSELYGKPLNVFADLSDDGIKDDAMFKNISSGDMITAQKKFGQPFQFTNSARQIYSVNDVPPVHKKTFAFFRRWILLCFPYTFVDNPAPDTNERKIGKGLLDALLTPEELSGAFNLVIECMKHMLAKGKYSYASTVADVTELYTLKSDPVKAFTDRYTDASEYHISVQEMYDGYVRWSKHKDLKILTAQRLTRCLKNLGFVESRPYDDYGSRIYAWVNVSFTESFDKEIPAEIKAEQKKLDDKYAKTDKKILYWQQLGEILDNLSEKTKDPNHAQISLKEQENSPTIA